jgi:hypothetical protein
MSFRSELNTTYSREVLALDRAWAMMACWRTFHASGHYCLSSILTRIPPHPLTSSVSASSPIRQPGSEISLKLPGSVQRNCKKQLNTRVATRARKGPTLSPTDAVTETTTLWPPYCSLLYRQIVWRSSVAVESASELYRPTDQRLSTKLVQNLQIGGQRDWSLRPYSRLSRPEPLLFLPSSSSIILTRLSGSRSRSTTSQKIW